MQPLDVRYTLQRIFETDPTLADVFRSNFRLHKSYALNSLLVLPDDIIYRLPKMPTLYFASPFNVGLQQWSVDNCALLFRNTYTVGTLSTLQEVRAAENTMFAENSQHLSGCFEITGSAPLFPAGRTNSFRVWPDTFQHTKVFGLEKEAELYINRVRRDKLGN